MPPHPQTTYPVRKKPYERPQASVAGTPGATEPKDKKRDKKEKKRAKEAAAAAAAAATIAASAAVAVPAPSAASTAMVAVSSSPEKKKRDKKKNKASSAATPPGGGTGPKPSGSLSHPPSLQTGAASSPSPRRAHKNLSHGHTYPHTPLSPATADPNVKLPSARVPSAADSEKEALIAKNRARHAERELHRAREEAKKRELIRQQLAEAQEELERLKKAEEEAKGREEALKKKLEEMEETVQKGEAVQQSQETVIRSHENTRRDLKEALSCGVCFETYNDPHILSCGHLACRDCLSQWFRTPGAYVTEPLDPITPSTDLSHRTKICHLCRAVVLRRPARAFFLRHILEPLGLHTSGPGASATPSPSKDAPGTASDHWRLIFPVEPSTYKLWDEDDGIHRCPTCTDEIEDGRCYRCLYEFSEEENSGDEEGLFDDEGEDGSGDDERDEAAAQNVLAGAVPNLFTGPYPPSLNNVMGALLADLRASDLSEDDDESSSRFRSDASDLNASEDDYGGSFIDDGPNEDRDDSEEDNEYGDEHEDSEDEDHGHRGGFPPRQVSSHSLPRPPPYLVPELQLTPLYNSIRHFSVNSDSDGVPDHQFALNQEAASESEVDAGAGSDIGSTSVSGSGSRAGRDVDAEDDADDLPVITGARPRRRGRIVVVSDEEDED